jgi:hypothetical protein
LAPPGAGRALLVAASVAVLGACGGGSGSAGPATTAAPASGPATTRPSNLGCDAVAQCFPELARATLERCPASRLDARGREARRRLERLLARIADVDLHNEQAYEASDAATAALADFEEHCL